jgi:PhzF family phenazine biosynthesis protein
VSRAFVQVDVFTTVPLQGNPAAVVFGSVGLDSATMQSIALEMNLSETVFVDEATGDGDYSVRIFTPRSELPFAGHPTLATAHAMVSTGRSVPRDGILVQECGAGAVTVEVAGGRYTLTAPPPRVQMLPAARTAELAGLLGCVPASVVAAAEVDVGIGWTTVQLRSGAEIAGLRPDIRGLGERGLDVTVYGREPDDDPWVRVRSFAPAAGITEDPVCGSGNACVAALLDRLGGLPPARAYRAVQGEECGRPGEVFVEVTHEGRARIGGACVTVLEGTLAL